MSLSLFSPPQQSQLAHYPERKIEEFQLKMEALEREYKRFVTKLRVLDPTCKHKPWTLRAYCKRRADVPEYSSIGQCTHIKTLMLVLWTLMICSVSDHTLTSHSKQKHYISKLLNIISNSFYSITPEKKWLIDYLIWKEVGECWGVYGAALQAYKN